MDDPTDSRPSLDGRAVELRVVPFGVLIQARKILARADAGPEDASMLVLVHSLHWADSGERVFRSMDDLMQWPSTSAGDLIYLTGEAATLNSPKPSTQGVDPAPPVNGAAEPVVAPSH